MSSSTSAQKWLELGVNAVLAAVALVPILRSVVSPSDDLSNVINPPRKSPGAFELVFMTSEQDCIATVPLDYATANEWVVDRHKIQSLAKHYKAYAAEIHAYQLKPLTRGPLTRQQVITQIANALREIGVKIIPDMNAC